MVGLGVGDDREVKKSGLDLRTCHIFRSLRGLHSETAGAVRSVTSVLDPRIYYGNPELVILCPNERYKGRSMTAQIKIVRSQTALIAPIAPTAPTVGVGVGARIHRFLSSFCRDGVLRSNCRLYYAGCRPSRKTGRFRFRANWIAVAAMGSRLPVGDWPAAHIILSID